MRTTVGALLVLTGVVAMTACGSGSGAGGAGEVWGRTFLSTAVTEAGKARPLVADTQLRLTFENGQVRANAGCNHMSGPASVEGGRLSVSDLATTSMACDPPRMEQDSWLAAFLGGGPTWRLDGDDLVLHGGNTEIRLTDRRTADPDRPLHGTRWVVDSIIDSQAVSSVPAGAEAYLTFGEGNRVEGSTGCNSLHGSAVEQGDRITFSQLATTKMACADEKMRLESAVLAVLDGEVTARIDADRLTLTRPDGRGLQLRAT
jgi:heat shock protein HslJ